LTGNEGHSNPPGRDKNEEGDHKLVKPRKVKEGGLGRGKDRRITERTIFADCRRDK